MTSFKLLVGPDRVWWAHTSVRFSDFPDPEFCVCDSVVRPPDTLQCDNVSGHGLL